MNKIKISWPIVGIVAIVCGFLVAIFALIPANMPEARTALLGIIGGAIGALQLWVVGRLQEQQHRTDTKINQIAQQTNGHMTTLLASKTQPDQADAADVSRETGGTP